MVFLSNLFFNIFECILSSKNNTNLLIEPVLSSRIGLKIPYKIINEKILKYSILHNFAKYYEACELCEESGI